MLTSPSRLHALVVAVVVSCAPGATPAGEGDALERKEISGLVVRHTTLAGEAPPGLSGISRDGAQGFFAIAERERELVRLRLIGARLTVTGRVPLIGVPAGLDTEALAFLGGDEVAMGTEGHEGRASDVILIGRVSAAGVTVTERLDFDYRPWSMRALVNHGVEALCFAEGVLLAVAEDVLNEDGKRFAPLARYDRAAKQWTHGRLLLTSSAGKISSLECRGGGPSGHLQVIALERHFGVSRVLDVEVPRDGPLGVLTARVRLDLAGGFDPLPNLEGLTWSDDGGLVLVADNSNVLKKPSAVFLIAPAAASARP